MHTYTHTHTHTHTSVHTGAHIYFGNRDAGGGTLDVDMNGGGPASKEPVENVFFGDAERGIEAPRGKYRVVVQVCSFVTVCNRRSYRRVAVVIGQVLNECRVF